MATTFLRASSSLIAFTTLIFLPIESTKVNLTSGKRMAKGIPGKPPPVPTSKTFELALKEINFPIARECRTCRS